ncbi:MAG: hypothetical protein K6G58_11095 [Lachnospiraceae bacterium]|nr:hypothetical protein [Lachnospiraceae bacterium]
MKTISSKYAAAVDDADLEYVAGGMGGGTSSQSASGEGVSVSCPSCKNVFTVSPTKVYAHCGGCGCTFKIPGKESDITISSPTIKSR